MKDPLVIGACRIPTRIDKHETVHPNDLNFQKEIALWESKNINFPASSMPTRHPRKDDENKNDRFVVLPETEVSVDGGGWTARHGCAADWVAQMRLKRRGAPSLEV